ncbi:MAG: hypothetical protein ACOYMG_03625 [Candidatus Methylumidiphilus sp.]
MDWFEFMLGRIAEFERKLAVMRWTIYDMEMKERQKLDEITLPGPMDAQLDKELENINRGIEQYHKRKKQVQLAKARQDVLDKQVAYNKASKSPLTKGRK